MGTPSRRQAYREPSGLRVAATVIGWIVYWIALLIAFAVLLQASADVAI